MSTAIAPSYVCLQVKPPSDWVPTSVDDVPPEYEPVGPLGCDLGDVEVQARGFNSIAIEHPVGSWAVVVPAIPMCEDDDQPDWHSANQLAWWLKNEASVVDGIADVDLDFCLADRSRDQDLEFEEKQRVRDGGRFVMAATVEAVFPVLVDPAPDVPDVARRIIAGLREATANLETWLKENAETADYRNAKVGSV